MQCDLINLKKIIQRENSRGKHNENDLAMLMSSIKKDGLLHPIGVRPQGKKFEIVYGNRRYEAYKKLGLNEIPCQIKDIQSRKDFLVLNLVENAQRSDVTAYEQGRLFTELQDKESMSIPEIAVRVGIAQGQVKACINSFKDTPKEFRDKVKLKTGGKNTRKGDIPLSLSEKIVHIGKRFNLSIEQRTELYKAVSEGLVDILKLKDIAFLIGQGLSVKRAIKNVGIIQYVTVRVPLFKDEVSDFKNEWDYSISEELTDAIYEATDFTKPF